MSACTLCGSDRDVVLFGNDPESFPVKKGIWPAGRFLCSKCLRLENLENIRALRSPKDRLDGVTTEPRSSFDPGGAGIRPTASGAILGRFCASFRRRSLRRRISR